MGRSVSDGSTVGRFCFEPKSPIKAELIRNGNGPLMGRSHPPIRERRHGNHQGTQKEGRDNIPAASLGIDLGFGLGTTWAQWWSPSPITRSGSGSVLCSEPSSEQFSERIGLSTPAWSSAKVVREHRRASTSKRNGTRRWLRRDLRPLGKPYRATLTQADQTSQCTHWNRHSALAQVDEIVRVLSC